MEKIVGALYTAQCKRSCNLFTFALDRKLQDQLGKYPEEMVEGDAIVGELVKKLVSRGSMVRLTQFLSPHGVWLTLRPLASRVLRYRMQHTSMKITYDIEELMERTMAFIKIKRPPRFKGLILE